MCFLVFFTVAYKTETQLALFKFSHCRSAVARSSSSPYPPSLSPPSSLAAPWRLISSRLARRAGRRFPSGACRTPSWGRSSFANRPDSWTTAATGMRWPVRCSWTTAPGSRTVTHWRGPCWSGRTGSLTPVSSCLGSSRNRFHFMHLHFSGNYLNIPCTIHVKAKKLLTGIGSIR